MTTLVPSALGFFLQVLGFLFGAVCFVGGILIGVWIRHQFYSIEVLRREAQARVGPDEAMRIILKTPDQELSAAVRAIRSGLDGGSPPTMGMNGD